MERESIVASLHEYGPDPRSPKLKSIAIHDSRQEYLVSLVTCLSAYYWLLVGKSWIRKVLKDHGMEAIELQKLVDVSRSVFGCSWATVASKWHLNVAYY